MANSPKQARHEDGPEKVCYKAVHFTIALRQGAECGDFAETVGGRQYITVNLDYL